MVRDPYDILGVPRDAGDEEIRRAYRRLAKQEHPDADGGAEKYFCRLNDAYESIRTPARRRVHSRDRAGAGRERAPWRATPEGEFRRGPERNGGPERQSGNFGFGPAMGSIFAGDLLGLFEPVFGGGLDDILAGAGPGGRRGGRGRHYRLEARLTPEEARRGVSMDLELADGPHRIDVPPGVRHGDVLSFSESTAAGADITVDLEVVVRSSAR